MKLIILTQNYLPEPDPKMHILARGLSKRGLEVTVVTAFPNYPLGRIYPGFRQRLWQWDCMDGIRILRLPLYADHSRSAWQRSLHYISFALTSSLIAPFLCGSADVMLVYHPPVTLAFPAWIISRLRGIPFIYEIQDMWPETLTATGMLQNRWILSLLEQIGQFIYQRADLITVITPGFGRRLAKSGVNPNKIIFMPNWAYEGIPIAQERNPAFEARVGIKDKFNILYAGNMGPAQGLGNILDAAARLKDLPQVQFVLIGSGVDFDLLRERILREELGNVCLLERIPMEDMPKLYAAAAAVMVHLTADPLFEITIPGKTQSSLASGRPILACVKGDAADMILEAGAGIVVSPMDPEQLQVAIRRFLALDAISREQMGAAGLAYYMSHLHPEILIKRYHELICGLPSRHGQTADPANGLRQMSDRFED